MRGIVWLILSFFLFFKSYSSDWKFILSQLYLFIKSLIFVIIFGFFPISSLFNSTVTTYGKHLLSFLLIGFIVNFLFFIQLGKSIYYNIYNALNGTNQR